MRRAATYARFSTDLQSERSVEDQLELCRGYCAREGLTIAASYSDLAKSGASIFGRDGLIALLAAARTGAFEVIVVEHSDRISRSMRDLADIYEQLTFIGIEIRAVNSGRLDTASVGLFGLVGQMQREEGAKKTRRGMEGVIRDGRSAGGRAYGYRPIQGRAGELAIDEAEAAIIVRIFDRYVAGATPREIASELNREGVPPPRGRTWNASTINGNPKRGHGILHNQLYAGRLVWNRVRMVKDPSTGKRVSRVNEASERRASDASHLAIVAADVFEAVQGRKRERATVAPEKQRRPRHVLSGLLRCGCCAGGMSTNGKDKSGRIRVRCSTATESGTCPDPKTFYLDTIERAVLSGLKRELRSPAVLAEYVRAYHEERQRLAAQSVIDRSRLERRLAELQRTIRRCQDAIIDERGNQDEWGNLMNEAAAEKRTLVATLADAPAPERVVTLHPATIASYERQLERLEAALDAGVRVGDTEAAEAVRDLVQTVVVRRDADRTGGVLVEVSGRLNSLLGEEAYPNGVRGVWGSMVAGDRRVRYPHPDPVPFRLISAA